MTIVKVSTVLNAHPDLVWKTVLKYQTLVHIMSGLIRFDGHMPEYIQPGDRLSLKLWFFLIVPGWRHQLEIVEVDTQKQMFRSEERGGLVKKWNHIVSVQKFTKGRTLYSDEIEIEAGLITPLVCAWAHFQYRYRQMRWRRLARTLTKGE